MVLGFELFGIEVATIDNRFGWAFGGGEFRERTGVGFGEESTDIGAEGGLYMRELTTEGATDDDGVGMVFLNHLG